MKILTKISKTKIIYIFIKTAYLLNLPFFFTIIFYLNLKKNKNIKFNKKNKTTLIVLKKSGGNEDIIFSTKNINIKKNILFSERFIFTQLSLLFSNYSITNTNRYKDLTREICNKKYNLFIDKFLDYLDLFLGKFEFVTFNFNYLATTSLSYICYKKKINFYICLKECCKTKGQYDIEYRVYKNYYKNLNQFTKMSVYNTITKNYLLKHKLINKNKVEVIGYPRDIRLTKKLTNVNSTKKKVILFLVNSKAGIPANQFLNYINSKYIPKNLKSINWNEIQSDTIKIFVNIAKKYPDINFYFKGKIGVHKKICFDLKNKYKLKNIKIIYGGSSTEIFDNCILTVSFGSTTVYESLLKKIPCLVPYYKKFRKFPYNHFTHTYPADILANDDQDLKKKIMKIINDNNIKIPSYNKITSKYLGETKNSNLKLRKFLNL